jgi:YggT family protein
MFVIGNLLVALGAIIGMVIQLYMWIVIIRAVLTWVNPDPYNPIVVFLNQVTDPVLRPIQKKIPPMNGIDFSPMILILALYFLLMFVPPTLRGIGISLGAGS